MCKFQSFIWKTNGDNGIRFLANRNLIKPQKGRRILNVRKMNLTSNESLVSIKSEVICTECLKSLLESVNFG